jgi:REP element-mobilizing transposase RayT
MKKLRNGQSRTTFNPKGAGRPKVLTMKEREKRIYHRSRPNIPSKMPVHVTVKTNQKDIGSIRSKILYKEIRQAMKRARYGGIRIIHFSVQKDHIHMIIEAASSILLGRAMRAMSISLSKRFTEVLGESVKALQNRYHLRLLKSFNQIKNAIFYVLNNGKKHLIADTIDFYSSNIDLSSMTVTEELLEFLDDLKSVLSAPIFGAEVTLAL